MHAILFSFGNLIEVGIMVVEFLLFTTNYCHSLRVCENLDIDVLKDKWNDGLFAGKAYIRHIRFLCLALEHNHTVLHFCTSDGVSVASYKICRSVGKTLRAGSYLITVHLCVGSRSCHAQNGYCY